jgi:DNA-directed RNA polymerase subunit RPC12/RpoP
MSANSNGEDLEEKKLLGSGGYVFAKLTEQEEIKAGLGVPQIFLGNIGRLNEARFTRYYCNKCKKEYTGSPAIIYENPNEKLGENVILIEEGEYRCRKCNSLIALYRKFNNT